MRQPDWLREADRAARSGENSRALAIVKDYAFRAETTVEAKHEAYNLAEAIRCSRGSLGADVIEADGIRRRLSRWSDPAVVRAARARAEKEQRREMLRRRREELDLRRGELSVLGVEPGRIEALAELRPGPYEVVLSGVGRQYDELSLRQVLHDLGYPESETSQALERVIHISPETVGHLLDQSAAIEIKKQLEAAGGKVRIRSRGQ